MPEAKFGFGFCFGGVKQRAVGSLHLCLFCVALTLPNDTPRGDFGKPLRRFALWGRPRKGQPVLPWQN
jgi:hypothetical protein